MSSKSRTRKQPRKGINPLAKLISAGLYKGKVDLRRKPTAHQKRLITKFADVIAGKAVVIRPKDPGKYKGTFRVAGKAVIVPRHKGEKITVGPKGGIKWTRKIAGKTRTGYLKPVGDVKDKANRHRIFALPLHRATGVDWYKFNSKEDLEKFIFETSPKIGQTFKRYAEYVVEFDLGRRDLDDVDDSELDDKLYDKLGKRRRARKRKAAPARKRRAARK